MKYSVITPVYNRADCVARCLDSVVRNLMWGIELEHIIVDDGSNDDTPQIIQQYVAKYSHIKFFPFPQNRGTNAARNVAIKAATGDFCIIIDSDDYFVDDAIKTINVVVSKGMYREYMFAPDDMQESYAKNKLLNHQQATLTYEQFLTRKISGDFIHVISTDVLKKFPFDESLRIYEGLFFLRFYRDAQKMLFTNKVVTIRERNREDSVTRETIRTNKTIIERKVKASEIYLDWYAKDLQSLHAESIIYSEYLSLLDNLLLASEYHKAKEIIFNLKESGKHIPFRLKLIYDMRSGNLYRIALKSFLTIKYNLLKTKLK